MVKVPSRVVRSKPYPEQNPEVNPWENNNNLNKKMEFFEKKLEIYINIQEKTRNL